MLSSFSGFAGGSCVNQSAWFVLPLIGAIPGTGQQAIEGRNCRPHSGSGSDADGCTIFSKEMCSGRRTTWSARRPEVIPRIRTARGRSFSSTVWNGASAPAPVVLRRPFVVRRHYTLYVVIESDVLQYLSARVIAPGDSP